MKLSDTKIKTAKPKKSKYRLSDGNGLSLVIYPNGSKIWHYRYQFNKKEHLLHLVSIPLLVYTKQERDVMSIKKCY